ncbi:alcohol dehydrogenase [Streptomyces sp. NPDC002574]|uniref:alcohol dehydrogenase n=1 Tax=Streptomyces sp. NPDC002574 TaxID=3364652 RepID=UPI00369C8660
MNSMRVAQVSEPGGPFDIVERELPEPGPGHVRIAVEASGVCHSDVGFVNNAYPGVSFPLVAGHEVAGRIDALGEGVRHWTVGDRVEVGWFGGHCGHCVPCREGDFIDCRYLQVPGWAYDGGYATHMVAPVNALARIPEGLTAVDAAPLGCAGVTTYNAFRKSVARPGDVVAVIGIGGLGHLAVQYAAKSGFETVAVARGEGKRDLAVQLGAHHYVDSTSTDTAKALQALGGATVVLATASNSQAMVAGVDGLRPGGELIVIGIAPEPMPITPAQLILTSRSVVGHPSGTSRDVEHAMNFSALAGIRPMTETVPLEGINEAYARMTSGAARFRMVVVP